MSIHGGKIHLKLESSSHADQFWAPGESIKGSVIIEAVSRALPIEWIRIELKCIERTEGDTVVRYLHSEPVYTSPNEYNTNESLEALPKGEHVVPFSIQVPTNTPSYPSLDLTHLGRSNGIFWQLKLRVKMNEEPAVDLRHYEDVIIQTPNRTLSQEDLDKSVTLAGFIQEPTVYVKFVSPYVLRQLSRPQFSLHLDSLQKCTIHSIEIYLVRHTKIMQGEHDHSRVIDKHEKEETVAQLNIDKHIDSGKIDLGPALASIELGSLSPTLETPFLSVSYSLGFKMLVHSNVLAKPHHRLDIRPEPVVIVSDTQL